MLLSDQPPVPNDRRSQQGSAEMVQLANSSNLFAADLYAKLTEKSKDRNLFFSPYSITSALTMVAEGARDNTAVEMAKVLHVPDPGRGWKTMHLGNLAMLNRLEHDTGSGNPALVKARAEIAKLRAELDQLNAQAKQAMNQNKYAEVNQLAIRSNQVVRRLNELLVTVDQYELRIANALWVQKDFPLAQPYQQTLASYYKTGGAFSVNFRTSPEQVRGQINDWVSNLTNRMIPELLPSGSVTPDLNLILTNAIYFKGEWSNPFDSNMTRELPFHLHDGQKIDVAMMQKYRADGLSYAAFDGNGQPFKTPDLIDPASADDPSNYPGKGGFQLLELPYKGGDLSMVIVLPMNHDDLGNVEKLLAAGKLEGWINGLRGRTVHAMLPKFKFRSNYGLAQILASMGMPRAFRSPASPDGAQFQGMTTGTTLAEQLYIGEVIHSAAIDVNEKGTEAAAATAILMAPGAALQPEKVPFIPLVNANHPFVFAIRDKTSKAILFMGRIMNPKQ